MSGEDTPALLPDRPPPDPPRMIEEIGAHGGPTFEYRGGKILCGRGSHVCQLRMPGHPLDGITMGVPGTITPLVDIWLDEGRLPPHIRAMRQERGGE
jgi:hypothetical protein